jgi:4-azaleucine resistance transporter AzlC
VAFSGACHHLAMRAHEPIARLAPGARAAIPLGVAALLLGVSFGIVAEPVIGSVEAVVMSAVVFAGAAQFAATAVLADGGGAAAAIVAGILLNLRFVPMGISIAPSLRSTAPTRAAVGQGLVDASWAIAHRGGGRYDVPFMIGATLVQYPTWVGGTVIGVTAGDVIGDPAALGLDAIFPAFFLALLANELRDGPSVGAALIGAALAMALTPVAPAGVPVLVASAGAALGLVRR